MFLNFFDVFERERNLGNFFVFVEIVEIKDVKIEWVIKRSDNDVVSFVLVGVGVFFDNFGLGEYLFFV